MSPSCSGKSPISKQTLSHNYVVTVNTDCATFWEYFSKGENPRVRPDSMGIKVWCLIESKTNFHYTYPFRGYKGHSRHYLFDSNYSVLPVVITLVDGISHKDTGRRVNDFPKIHMAPRWQQLTYCKMSSSVSLHTPVAFTAGCTRESLGEFKKKNTSVHAPCQSTWNWISVTWVYERQSWHICFSSTFSQQQGEHCSR